MSKLVMSFRCTYADGVSMEAGDALDVIKIAQRYINCPLDELTVLSTALMTEKFVSAAGVEVYAVNHERKKAEKLIDFIQRVHDKLELGEDDTMDEDEDEENLQFIDDFDSGSDYFDYNHTSPESPCL